jgi:DNA-binding FadR family transcriptional regulator
MEEREIEENYQDLCDLVKAIEQEDPENARRLAQDHVKRFNRYMQDRERKEKTGPPALPRINGARRAAGQRIL